MKKSYAGLLLLLGSLMLQPAQAWIAMSLGSGNFTFAARDYKSPEGASEAALNGCNENTSKCSLWLEPTAGPLALALATGGDTKSYSYNKDPQKAYDRALAKCREDANGCKVVAIYWEGSAPWYAITGGDMPRVSYNNDSEAIAREEALKFCQQNDSDPDQCEVSEVNQGPGWYAHVSSDAHWAWAVRDTKAEAVKAAMERCKKSSSTSACKLKTTLFLQGRYPEPASFIRLKNRIETNKKQTPEPVSRQVSCTNQCINGNCLRTFPNGKTERWQAPRTYNSLSGNWEWDTSSCTQK